MSRGFHSIYIDSVVPSFPPLELYLDFTVAANSVPPTWSGVDDDDECGVSSSLLCITPPPSRSLSLAPPGGV